MNSETDKRLQAYIKRQQQQRQQVLSTLNRGMAAADLAEMSLEHGSNSAHAAATLLLAMEYERPYDLTLLMAFDTENRAKADLILMGYQPGQIFPSRWITEEAGKDGNELMTAVFEKWGATQ